MYFALLFFTSALVFTVDARGGSATLDEITFDKILPKFRASLIKFDSEDTNSYEKEDTFRELVREFAETEDFLFAQVEVNENDAFSKRYSMDTKDFPVIKLFKGSTNDPLTFDGEWTKDNILEWLKKNSGVRFSLPSCLSSFDELAESFMAGEPAERAKLLKKAKAQRGNLEDKAKKSADVYVKIMQKTLDRGTGFVASEEARVKNLLDSKITEAKRTELVARLNIIRSFVDQKAQGKKPENEESEAKPATQSKATQTDDEDLSKGESDQVKGEL